MSDRAPMIPTVHMNGTGGETLLDQYAGAYDAVTSALHALCNAGPNSRDYYVQGPDAGLAAQREHEDRVKALRKVREELVAIRDGIQDQLDARDAQRKAR